MLTSKLLGADHYEEDTDLLTRGPYEFQFRVDDPETFNKYEVIKNAPRDQVWFKSDKNKKYLDPGNRRSRHCSRQLQD